MRPSGIFDEYVESEVDGCLVFEGVLSTKHAHFPKAQIPALLMNGKYFTDYEIKKCGAKVSGSIFFPKTEDIKKPPTCYLRQDEIDEIAGYYKRGKSVIWVQHYFGLNFQLASDIKHGRVRGCDS